MNLQHLPLRQLLEKVIAGAASETHHFQPRLEALRLASALLPRRHAGRRRAQLFKLAGFVIGEGTLLEGNLRITGDLNLFSNLVVGDHCHIMGDCLFDLEERISVGDRVTIAPGAMILTSTHELAAKELRAGPVIRQPVTIGDGSLIGARAIILPGVTVGNGAVIDAGAVVGKDVSPHTRVAGSPAVQREVLSYDAPVNSP